MLEVGRALPRRARRPVQREREHRDQRVDVQVASIQGREGLEVAGTVVDGDGVAVPSFDVHARLEEGCLSVKGEWLLLARTDERGSFQLYGLRPSSTYEVLGVRHSSTTRSESLTDVVLESAGP